MRTPNKFVFLKRGEEVEENFPTKLLVPKIEKKELIGSDEISADGIIWIRLDKHTQLKAFFSNLPKEAPPTTIENQGPPNINPPTKLNEKYFNFLVWWKFIYLLLIAINLVVVLLVMFKNGQFAKEFQLIYIPSLYKTSPLLLQLSFLFMPLVFFVIHLMFLKALLLKSMSQRQYGLERRLTYGRFAMAGMTALFPIMLKSHYMLTSPVANSLWGWLKNNFSHLDLMGIDFIYLACSLLLIIEAVYLFLLSEAKDDLLQIDGVQPLKEKSPDKASEFIKVSSRFWQLKFLASFAVIFLIFLAGRGVVGALGLINPKKIIHQVEYQEGFRSRGKTYHLDIPAGYFLRANPSIFGGAFAWLKAVYNVNPKSYRKEARFF